MSEGMSLSQINRPTINMDNTNVANNPNDKASGEEYFDRRGQNQNEEEFQQSSFVDRSAQLRATLNSLAALNAANVVKAKDKYKKKLINNKVEIEDNSAKVLAINEEENSENNQKQNDNKQETVSEETTETNNKAE
ncbi:MAG: hypothetical protein MJ180_03820 [Candidatus Gastranaerophilales bacterium]|nr:hypothetical protein [Candidatus Gastranaerophilales bacterium]